MSDADWSRSSTPPPPPPPPPGAATSPMGQPSMSFPAAPPAYAAPGSHAGRPVSAPTGLRTATVVLCWVVTALTVVLGLVAYQRGNVARDVLNGTASLTDANDADNRVGGAVVILVAAMLATAIVICLWSSRTVGNAKRRDPQNPGSPGLAAGGWFIPIGWLFVSFQQFRAATQRFGAKIGSLSWWQAAFIVAWVLLVVQRIQGNVTAENFGDSESRLHGQGLIILVAAVAFAVASISATKAMREIDETTSGSRS